jgi:DNA-binding MarR family transcriptional regulator
MYHDRQDEKQITATVLLKESELGAVRQLLEQLVASHGVQDESANILQGPERDSERRCIELARRIVTARQVRSAHFKKPMFGEPAWDMLLALYANSTDGPRQSIGRLTALSGSPPTTALRWLDYLVKEQLVAREANPTDGRSDFVELTEKGRSAMERYLSETLRTLA